MAEQQTYQNHVRWFPLVHFIIMPLLVLNFLYQAVRLYQEPSWDRGIWVVLCTVFILMTLAGRLQALKAQDRLIRLEERLRHRNVLGNEIAERASNLPIGQVIALRFASDEELPELIAQVLDGRFTTSKEIKTAVKNWRGDYLRV